MNTYKITSLAENTTFRHNCLAQHGQSILIEIDNYKLLFDVGEVPGAIEHNMKQLKVSLGDINDIVISHRHIDHVGALNAMLPSLTDQRILLPTQMGELHIKKHPYKYNFMDSNANDQYDVAISKADSEKLFSYHNSETTSESGKRLYENIFVTGCVGDWMHEQAIVIDQKELGITVILGCSHPGVEALLAKAHEVTGNNKLRGVIGGMHYTDYSDEEMYQHAKDLKQKNPEFIMPGHCTTVEGCRVLAEVIGDKVVLSKTGTFATGNTVVVGSEIEVQFV